MPRSKLTLWTQRRWRHCYAEISLREHTFREKRRGNVKKFLRQRLYWARLRARIRNRIHALIDWQRELAMPRCSDLFGRKALVALKKLPWRIPTQLCCAKSSNCWT
jgi:hypothetical protein